MTQAIKLYQRYTEQQLIDMRQQLIDDPANAYVGPKSICLYTEKTYKKIEQIVWAIYHHGQDARKAAGEADQAGDPGTNDLLVSNVVRTNELQVWFLAEHLVPIPLVQEKSA